MKGCTQVHPARQIPAQRVRNLGMTRAFFPGVLPEKCMTGSSRTLLARQGDAKDAAFPKLGVQFDAPGLAFHRPSRNGEAQAGAAVSVRAGFVDAVEALENFVTMLRRDAWPFVSNFENYFASTFIASQANRP